MYCFGGFIDVHNCRNKAQAKDKIVCTLELANFASQNSSQLFNSKKKIDVKTIDDLNKQLQTIHNLNHENLLSKSELFKDDFGRAYIVTDAFQSK